MSDVLQIFISRESAVECEGHALQRLPRPAVRREAHLLQLLGRGSLGQLVGQLGGVGRSWGGAHSWVELRGGLGARHYHGVLALRLAQVVRGARHLPLGLAEKPREGHKLAYFSSEIKQCVLNFFDTIPPDLDTGDSKFKGGI